MSYVALSLDRGNWRPGKDRRSMRRAAGEQPVVHLVASPESHADGRRRQEVESGSVGESLPPTSLGRQHRGTGTVDGIVEATVPARVLMVWANCGTFCPVVWPRGARGMGGRRPRKRVLNTSRDHSRLSSGIGYVAGVSWRRPSSCSVQRRVGGPARVSTCPSTGCGSCVAGGWGHTDSPWQLADARVRVMSVAEIARSWTTGHLAAWRARNAPRRHHTLSAVIGRSWNSSNRRRPRCARCGLFRRIHRQSRAAPVGDDEILRFWSKWSRPSHCSGDETGVGHGCECWRLCVHSGRRIERRPGETGR